MNLQALYTHLDGDAKRVLSDTADQAGREQRLAMTIELFLLGLARDRGCGPRVMKALESAGADAPGIESFLAERVASEKRRKPGTHALPGLDVSLEQLLRESWSLAFDDYGVTSVTPVRFFETLVRKGDLWPGLAAGLPGFARVDVAKLAAAAGPDSTSPREASAGPAATASQRYPELSRYGRDLVSRSREGGIDPAIGIEDSIRAIASILLRRRQNSAIVVGEAGVGKTAAALGFVDALARATDSVPERLHDTPVWSLDLSALRAGAMVRGALEERLQAILREAAGDAMILFLDDIDLLFGDQSQGGDALRSLLDDGAVRILGTCRWREWRRLIEPDAGLARRLAPVRIPEPDDERSIEIVSGGVPALEAHHSVRVGKDAVTASVHLSRRYIIGRQLPDKAVAALDSACARATMRAPRSDDAPEVGTEDVAQVVSDLTGVPVGGLLTDASQTASRLESLLGERVVGQPRALARCAAQARAYLAGLSDRRRPVGALMFAGPSGIGKTETAHAIADSLFGGRLLTVNMSEYQEAHTVSGLKGAPAGYVGYGEGGVLTEGIRRTPYCVLLLDEIEKAHSDVIEMLYQVLDRGWMSDAEGLEADFSNCLIVLTTNAGDTLIEEAARARRPPGDAELGDALMKELAKRFPAAFLGRLQVVPYWPLGDESLTAIASMRLRRLAQAYEASHRAALEFGDDVRSWLAARVRSTPQGARFLDGIIAGWIRPAIADYVLAALGSGEAPGSAIVSHDGHTFRVTRRETSSA